MENLQANFKDFIEASKSNLLESNRKWFNFAKELLLLVKRAERGEKVRLDHFERFFRGNVDEHI